jgi:hypothetical protein
MGGGGLTMAGGGGQRVTTRGNLEPTKRVGSCPILTLHDTR